MSKKILIVEDYEDSRLILKLLINSFGYEALVAANGEEAVQIAKIEKPDVILMDMALPVMSGLKATKIIRDSADISNIPIIAITAHGVVIDKEAIKAGCNEVINKPLDYENILPILKKYLDE
ncbi:MAG TPA: response regulator [Pyrinomonadaceae bacterium]|nr:response regulator [Pyrinomonadaceae bacterium]